MSGKITRVYGGFRGADFRGEEVNLSRSPDCLNVWKDYRETDSIRTRPALNKEGKIEFKQKVYGIFFYKAGDTEMMIVHSGGLLYKVTEGKEPEEMPAAVNPSKGAAFVFNGKWFFTDGQHYLQYDGVTVEDVVGYVPTTSINGKATTSDLLVSANVPHQDANMLSDSRYNTFCGDGSNLCFVLDTLYDSKGKCEVEEVKVNGAEIKASDYSVWHTDKNVWYVEFKTAPPSPATTGQDNVSIKFRKTNEAKSQILKCTMIELFDNRVFFSGNPDFPNRIWHSALQEPSYCSDLDYYNEGLDTSAVKAMVAGNNNLWVFKEPSQANTTIFYHTPALDDEYGKIYPNTHSSISTGCVGKAINFNDDIVFFSDRGMEGISGDITTEQVIEHRSSLIDSRLLKEDKEAYADMILTEWEGYLLVIIGKKIYLADSRAVFTNEDHIEYEWFYWEMSESITCAKVNGGVLHLGTESGVYKLSDYEGPVKSRWVTPKDKFDCPHYLKTTNKRGFVAEAKGDITLYAKTEKTEYELIDTYEGIEDYFVSRIRLKKFKDLQLKFSSETRFSLETATIESFIGGYIKR
ncbi:MAG: hypothetical protein IJO73_02355 [Clostridia bacterium]|nr:hypothetical protein [Clostridia bacterium]